ncbi:NADH-quinone oxidoreductase subunit NuoN [Malaciobacter molluscorum LMG 25693]|uniref:NADH-quinone oxidoreductase subunit N n=1 Tax=Malaciobacter molluscorum LMG 25693 TaxID=870501 RepID=A0A2G1DFL5_9BACT|nr:NADH-quinone oxidoreductase subunit NuoN [Malaciobacter molluscorum]AXX93571.1 NADH:quinone oxidoreductase I, membrane subunit N [Malaciobacter molluscorum LMG 25693]PHO17275.1 NADH-quinone oxidoreductase subunit NuoN [Malaciobacter molluscorum LMG 25693]
MSEIPKITVDFFSLNFATIAPMIIVIVAALLILCIDLANKHLDKSLYIILAILALLIDLGFVLGFDSDTRGFFDLLLFDGVATLSQVIIIISSIFFMLLYFNKLKFHELNYPEYFALYLFAVAGFQFMVTSDSLILIFVALETSSMALYTMIAMHNRLTAIEAAIKYFTMGALSTAFFAFGSMIFYAQTGSVELSEISQVLTASGFNNYTIVLVGTCFIVAALAFKLSLFPFHLWVADVYEGSTSALAGFLSVVPKIAGFIVALRFFEIFIIHNDKFIEMLLYVIVILTMTIPNVIALLQNDFKRMLAYSSISNAGFAMAAILIGTTQATQSLFLYWIMFFITNLGAFAILWLNRTKNYTENSDDNLKKYKGLIKTSPLIATLMGIFMISLAGLPPFSLFWGKLYLIGSAVNAGHLILAVVMILNSAIAAYYYLKPVVFIFLNEPENDTLKLENSTSIIKFVVITSAIFTIFSIFIIEPLLQIISYYTQISGF